MSNIIQKTISKSKSTNPKATFNQPKSLSSITKSKSNILYYQDELSLSQLKVILPNVNLPKYSTMIKTEPSLAIFKTSEVSQKSVLIKTDKSNNFKIDTINNKLIFDNGKSYDLDILNELNSRTGKSIDKDTAIEIANEYLKLNIPSKNKKSVFVKAIREKIGI